jgi:hypothetical protein
MKASVNKAAHGSSPVGVPAEAMMPVGFDGYGRLKELLL